MTLYRSSLCIRPEGISMGLDSSIVDKLLSSGTTCTISRLGSNRSALHCVLFPSHASVKKDYFLRLGYPPPLGEECQWSHCCTASLHMMVQRTTLPPWRHESSHSSLGRYICRSVHTDARAETRTMYWEGLFWTTSTNNPPAIWNTYFHVYKLNSLRLRCLHWRDANLCNGLSWVGIFN